MNERIRYVKVAAILSIVFIFAGSVLEASVTIQNISDEESLKLTGGPMSGTCHICRSFSWCDSSGDCNQYDGTTQATCESSQEYRNYNGYTHWQCISTGYSNDCQASNNGVCKHYHACEWKASSQKCDASSSGSPINGIRDCDD